MRRSTLWTCALLAIATLGCKQVSEQFAKVKEKVSQKIAAARQRTAPRQQPAPAQPPATPTQPAPTPTVQPARPETHHPATARAPAIPTPNRDAPYVSEDTGTIAPGMTEKDVYSLWGPPAAVRHSGEYTYLYFRNGCEYSCGMLDLVTLQNGQVVDAVLRWPGHQYSGQSSSPKGVKPHANPGGDTLTVRQPATP